MDVVRNERMPSVPSGLSARAGEATEDFPIALHHRTETLLEACC
jgi:hypothetical protein